jgi:hypothetical protein
MENTKKSFGEIWAELTTEQTEYLKGYIDRQRQDAVKHYQAEQLRLHNERSERFLVKWLPNGRVYDTLL